MSDNKNLENQLIYAMAEDLGEGDITSTATIDPDAKGEAKIMAKQIGVFSGGEIAARVFSIQDKNLQVSLFNNEGDQLVAGDTVMIVEGKIQSILSAERTALNFLGHLSGIATKTFQFVDLVKGTKAHITDTRKTTPGWRFIEKEAVLAGGGVNHRMGLDDMVLIKENHIEAAGGISRAVEKSKSYLHNKHLNLKIEVETTTLDEVKEALEAKVDRIMLDNMSAEMMREAVKLVAGRSEIEASGGVTIETVRKIAETGVDFISVGALTHSAPVFDFTLLLNRSIQI